MSEDRSDIGPTIPGPYLSPNETESSPLKNTLFHQTKRSFVNWIWGWDFSLESAGSLKSVVVFLFGTAGIVTLALLTQLYYGETQVVRHGAVVTDHETCTRIGADVLAKGGNAVDAAVASTICLGVVHFHVTGLGGGGFLLGYNQKRQKVIDVVNFEPVAAKKDVGDQVGQTVGVPGFLAGLWSSHQRHGKLPWQDLVMPSVDLARNGFLVSPSLAAAVNCVKPGEHGADLKGLLASLEAGQNATLPRLAATLELIAVKGASVFYNGSLADELVYVVKVGNGSLSKNDIASYSPMVDLSQSTVFEKFQVIVPVSYGGTYLLNVLESIQNLELQPNEQLTAEMVMKVSDVLYEAQKMLIAKNQKIRKKLANSHGCNVVVMDSEDNYVSIVSGLNEILGSQLLTESGFILNNALINGIDENGRPASLAVPVVVVEKDKVCGERFVSGAVDARALAQVLTQIVSFKDTVNDSIEAPRVHLGAVPRSIFLEDHRRPQFSDLTVTALKGKKFQINSEPSCSANGPPGYFTYNSINIVSKIMDDLWSHADGRGDGLALQF